MYDESKCGWRGLCKGDLGVAVTLNEEVVSDYCR